MSVLKKADHDATAVLASMTQADAETGAFGSAVRLAGMVNGFAFILDVTAAATDVTDTLDVYVQTKIDGTNWVDVVHFTQVLGNGGEKRYIAKIAAGLATTEFEVGAALGAAAVRNLLGDEWRVKWVTVDADADASFTFGVTAIPM